MKKRTSCFLFTIYYARCIIFWIYMQFETFQISCMFGKWSNISLLNSGLLLRFCIQRCFSPTHYPKYSSYNYTILITITYEFNKRQKYFVISCSCLYIHVYIWVLHNVRNTIRINPNTNHSSIFMIIYAYHCIITFTAQIISMRLFISYFLFM